MNTKSILIIILLLSHVMAVAQKQKRYNAIYSGVPWLDDKGNAVNAHGANIVQEKGRYYLFGEYHTDTSNAFAGFSCYSSADLYNWRFERMALPVQPNGKLGPNRRGERPKVMKCPATGEYIMYMHVDNVGLTDQFVGYATSNKITGPYTFRGPLLFNGSPILKWDMGTFQDKDGAGYVLLHGGDIYKLHDDYKSITEQVCKSFTNGFESPAIFRKDSIYYFLGSHLTSWERNDNYYYTATSLAGPWTFRGLFAPTGTLTWNSQTTFVLPVAGAADTTYMFMGDRWSYPKQGSAATYVWQPLTVSGYSVSIPDHLEAWQINTTTGVASAVQWQHGSSDTLSWGSSDKKDTTFSAAFTGKQMGLYGLSRPDGGYARVVVRDRKQKVVLSSIIDMYCKYPVRSLKFLTPSLPKDRYTVQVTVMGERGNWSDKKKNLYGSTGYFVSLDKMVVNGSAQKNVFPIVTKTVKVAIVYDHSASKLDSIAAGLLAADIERVTSFKPPVLTDLAKAKGHIIVIGAVHSPLVQKITRKGASMSKTLNGQWERFALSVVDQPLPGISKALVIAGSDARGTAYGVFTLSEKIGVSPWYWWADVPAKKQTELIIHQDHYISPAPAVQYRGIFINDEDWGLQPWAAKTFEPETGDIGPKTYAKVFELLLRLKANCIWPAMHPSTKAFFHYPGNVKTAEDYQIMIGSSHAEPMLRNNVGEWDGKAMGHFNYFTNKEKIYTYWEDRVKQSRGINAIYTLGMRGVHDGQMEGVNNLKEAVPVVEGIIGEQRDLLSKYINRNITAIPQVLTPYKEVLEIYDHGLKVPDDVTLVWPDDNYGYIHRLNNEKEIKRTGGAGVYYHASYWGRPHDYLWLPSTHPGLLREEMMKAYETGARRLWILNVGDIKPQEYNLQQFMDMAWDPAPFKDSRYTKQHMLNWTTSIFGKEKGQQIQSILWEYYQLAFERRPEFMGWSQTEPTTQTTYTAFNHFYFGDEAQKRIDRYSALETTVKKLRPQINPATADAFYQLVYYPVTGASWINKKFLYRDKSYFYAKQNRLSAYDYAQLSKAAYDSIIKETAYFNTRVAGGKWKYVMLMNPRNLPVYQPPVLPAISIDSTAGWSIAPEGYVTKDSALTSDHNSMSLPAFDNLNKQQYFIDIFLSKQETIQWNALTSHTWIRLSENNGTLTPGPGKKQLRIQVDIDWDKFAGNGKTDGSITFVGGDKKMTVSLRAVKIDTPALAGFKGFIENNGLVSIRAAGFTRQTSKTPNRWTTISDFGYAGNVLQAFPLSVEGHTLTDPDSIKQFNAVVEYDFYSFLSAAPFVTVFALPTHPINNNYSCRYAVSIDEGPLMMVDIKTVGRSGEWKQNVLRNRAERTIAMPFLEAGKHTLKIYAVDPGVILDEIRIDTGRSVKAYSTIPETKIPHE